MTKKPFRLPGRRAAALAAIIATVLAAPRFATASVAGVPAASACIASGTDASINAALVGTGATAVLCPGAVFTLNNSITFTAPNQVIETQGLPTDTTRADLKVNGGSLTTAINGNGQPGAVVENIQVDGGRPQFGRSATGGALLEMGAGGVNQTVQNIYAHDTRSWSTLHITEGVVTNSVPQCQGAKILGNAIGPAGTASPAGTWADGISLACGNSLVQGNTVQDATDGGIVVFGAPGSTIKNNTVVALTQTLLGGINMVDYAPMNGNYTGTTVTGNTIDARSAFIKVGIAMGPQVWGCGTGTNNGGTVTGNTLQGRHMGYGYAVNGVSNWTVTGNADNSTHVGVAGAGCGGTTSAPAGFQVQSATSSTLQPGFQSARLTYVLAVTEPSGASTLISLRAHANGKIVTADNAGAAPLIANRTAIGSWETFDELDQGYGNIALRAHANNQIVCADNAGAAPLIANRTAVGPWETFNLIHNPDGSVSLRSMANNMIVTADNAGASPLIANRTAIGTWEEFDLIHD
jgi:parallel beta-helix repeat protein